MQEYVAKVVGRGRAVRKGKAAAAGQRRKFFVVSVFFATMPRSRPAHILLFPQPLANAAVAGVKHTSLLSRPWYTQSTTSLAS